MLGLSQSDVESPRGSIASHTVNNEQPRDVFNQSGHEEEAVWELGGTMQDGNLLNLEAIVSLRDGEALRGREDTQGRSGLAGHHLAELP